MCGMRFAERSATLSVGYIRIGAVPGDNGCCFLARLAGLAKAPELLLAGEFVGAKEALPIGMVNRVYGDDELEDSAQAFAEKIPGHSPTALRAIKQATYQSLRIGMKTSLDMISSQLGMVQTLQDAAEAFAAFRERRAPRFEGR